ncbi:NlpC/P60 family protein [Actinoplanes sp. NPDC051346]|uniref:fibronectin type III domain-containing protein n=1 Tax=Actinoplanes sp. NPDC051346 TaxID=3155048 RepID=UPI00342FD079
MRVRAILVLATALAASLTMPPAASAAPAPAPAAVPASYHWENPATPNARTFTQAAVDQLGRSYCWGGGDLSGATYGNPDSGCHPHQSTVGAGFDCSGLVHYALGRANLPMEDRTAQGFSALGSTVSAKEDLLPGDLLFYDSGADGEYEHVAIYLGRNLDNADRPEVVEAHGIKPGSVAPEFQVRIRAYDPGEATLVKRIFTLAPAPTASATVTGPGSVTVNWTDRYATEHGFQIMTGLTFSEVPADVTTKTYTGLAAGTQVCFTVLAFIRSPFAGGGYEQRSDWSNNACVTVPAAYPPAAPGSPIATPVNATTIRVSWTDRSNNETGFEINNGVTTVRVAANATSYLWSGLTPGTYMCFRVRAVNAVGASPWTPGWTCTTTPNNGPAAPSAVAVTTLGTSVHVTWRDNSSNETGFKLTKRQGGTVTQAGVTGPDTTEVWLPGQPPRTQMCFAVASFHAGGQSPWTPEVCVTTP